ncbi:MAG: O-antigen ligase family protein, partial [Verrucomicrobiota bacterium]
EPLAFLAVPVWGWVLLTHRDARGLQSPYLWPVACFIAMAALSSMWSVRPELTLHRCHRLLLLPIIFAMWTAFRPDREGGWEQAVRAVVLFVAGCALRGVYDVVRVAVEVSRGVPLYHTGNMRDPQMYMAALGFLAALLIARGTRGRNPSVWAAAAACGAGLVLHFKRGCWFAFGFAAAVMGLMARRWKVVLVLVLCAAGLLLVPQVRDRVEMLRTESSFTKGGRYVLWAEVAPAMLRDYPRGMGWGAVRHEDLREYSWRVQPGLDHLHNNALQVALELGWAGLAIWLWWMGTAFGVMLGAWRRSPPGDPAQPLALGTFGAFLALMTNGVVEYNFGDSEILMLLCFLMGLSGVLRGKTRPAGGVTSS